MDTTTTLTDNRRNLTPFSRTYRPKTRSLLRDALELEEVIHRDVTTKKLRADRTAALVRSFCSLVPVIRALQGKTLVLSGTFSADRDPIALAKRIRQMSQKQRLSGKLIDLPIEESPETTKADDKPKGIS